MVTMKNQQSLATLVLFPFSSLFTMEQPSLPKVFKVPALKEFAARQLALSCAANPNQTPPPLDLDCRDEVARQILLHKKFQEVASIDLAESPLYLLKEDCLAQATYYSSHALQKPTKHNNNPFMDSINNEEGLRFGYDFTQTEPPSNLQYFVVNAIKK